ncbi:MAG: peptide chain release factor N(5)-glutamine methyltransferase [Gemmatimonadales bacterium]|nr:peptide chain release factor N(5)-glutamine methyltransferase [Gemmatimonadales bacterium]
MGSALSDAAVVLRAAGLSDARREALRIWDDLGGDTVRFHGAIARRAEGEPLPYVTGLSGFRHLTLRADRRALIPRPETEGLVDLVLRRACTGCIADVGTGSGCIALSLAQEGGYTSVLAIDRSAPALELARENARGQGISIQSVRADLTTALAARSLDALVSNPPYLTSREYHELDAGVRAWEPMEALDAGLEGMDVIVPLLQDGLRVLRPGGWLALELDARRARECARRAAASGWEDVSIQPDLFGRDRYLLARRSITP